MYIVTQQSAHHHQCVYRLDVGIIFGKLVLRRHYKKTERILNILYLIDGVWMDARLTCDEELEINCVINICKQNLNDVPRIAAMIYLEFISYHFFHLRFQINFVRFSTKCKIHRFFSILCRDERYLYVSVWFRLWFDFFYFLYLKIPHNLFIERPISNVFLSVCILFFPLWKIWTTGFSSEFKFSD